MKKFTLSIIAGIICAVKLAAAIATGEAAPNLPSPVWLDGKMYRLSEYKNKKIAVLFLWSPDQRALAEFQNMNRIAKQYTDDQTVFLGIGNANAEFSISGSLSLAVSFLEAGYMEFFTFPFSLLCTNMKPAKK